MDKTALELRAQAFAEDLTSLLRETLPGASPAKAIWNQDRVVVRPGGPIRLLVKNRPLATLDLHLRCRMDAHGKWLAIEQSGFNVYAALDKMPIFRFEYVRDARTCPCAHIQVHAHRGALSHLLSQAGHDSAHDMSALHLPVGGARFRPCLEDVIHFLIEDCGFDSVPNWFDAVKAGRARWRRIQARTVARDLPEDAAEALRALGYTVMPPAVIPTDSEDLLYVW